MAKSTGDRKGEWRWTRIISHISPLDTTPRTGAANTYDDEGLHYVRKLISFDIDNVLEIALEPGPITLDMVRRAQEMGYIIGSCSDIPVPQQRAMWEKHGINVDFAVLKHYLGELRSQFEADEYYLVSPRDTGDYSFQSGFVFLQADTTTNEPWMLNCDDEPSS